MTEQEKREIVRRSYHYRCGYCGVHEEEVGSELEIDHFQPRSQDGGEDLENPVYCCTACNRRKGDFWPSEQASTSRRLLHPRRDEVSLHLREEIDGRLIALTETGVFHIERLHLNRPPLIALRRTRHEVAFLQQGLKTAQDEQIRVQQRVGMLEQALAEVLNRLARLLES